jgi:hypothetical protein
MLLMPTGITSRKLALGVAFTPDELRGRATAVNGLFIGASNQLGEFRAGAMAAWIGAVPAVLVGGVGTLVITLAWAKLFPALWRADRMDSAR